MLTGSLSVSTGWLVFVLGLAGAAALVPLGAALLRRALPRARRAPLVVEPVAFGGSPRAQRSPRQAIRLHRSVLTSTFMAALAVGALALVLAIDALGAIGAGTALVFVGPTLLVALHGRRRSERP